MLLNKPCRVSHFNHTHLLLLLLGLLFLPLLHLRVVVTYLLHLRVHLGHLPPLDVRFLLEVLLANVSRGGGDARLAFVTHHTLLVTVHYLLRHVLVNAVAVLLRLVNHDHLTDVVRFEEIYAVDRLEGRTHSRQVHYRGLERLPVHAHPEADSRVSNCLALAIELHVDLGHGIVIGVAEVQFDLFCDMFGKANDELVLRLKYA